MIFRAEIQVIPEPFFVESMLGRRNRMLCQHRFKLLRYFSRHTDHHGSPFDDAMHSFCGDERHASIIISMSSVKFYFTKSPFSAKLGVSLNNMVGSD